MENQAIVATDLTKWFGEGETRKTAVNRVGLVAHFGEMLFIVGPSGSGKTTMLSMISGILRPVRRQFRRQNRHAFTLYVPGVRAKCAVRGERSCELHFICVPPRSPKPAPKRVKRPGLNGLERPVPRWPSISYTRNNLRKQA